MNFYEITVKLDPQWPDNTIYEGRVNGRRVLGWWTREELDYWMTRRCGSITSEDNGVMIVVAQLTKKEVKR